MVTNYASSNQERGLAMLGLMKPLVKPAAVLSLVLVAGGMFTVVGGTSGVARADDLTARLKFHPNVPVQLSGEQVLRIKAKFDTRFASIESLCLTFMFEGDLLDPGEELTYRLAGATTSFGFVNVGISPEAERTSCLVAGFHDAELALFLDGKNTVYVMADTGSVTVASVTMNLTGTPA
jgi:hypothetical protein